jgi:hypothetical protein
MQCGDVIACDGYVSADLSGREISEDSNDLFSRSKRDTRNSFEE